eukprot:Sdes_comp16132_c0_seq1m5362
MSESLKSVGWFHSKEWEKVYRLLFSESKDEQREGIQRVELWSLRCKVPVAIEASSDFVRLLLLEGDEMLDRKNVCLLYSMAFTRFINGVVDLCQKGAYAKSVASICESISIPLWFVDLRHEATHSALPSICVLQLGAQKALQWLQKNYWDSQLETLRLGVEETVQVLRKYRKYQKHILERVSSGQDYKPLKEVRNTFLARLVRIGSQNSLQDTILASLLEVGFLIPTKISYRPTLSEPFLSRRSLNLWGPLLKYFHQSWPHFTVSFLRSILFLLTIPSQNVSVDSVSSLICCGPKLWKILQSRNPAFSIPATEDHLEYQSCLVSLLSWAVHTVEAVSCQGGSSRLFRASQVSHRPVLKDAGENFPAGGSFFLSEAVSFEFLHLCQHFPNPLTDRISIPLQDLMKCRGVSDFSAPSSSFDWSLIPFGYLPDYRPFSFPLQKSRVFGQSDLSLSRKIFPSLPSAPLLRHFLDPQRVEREFSALQTWLKFSSGEISSEKNIVSLDHSTILETKRRKITTDDFDLF